MIRVTLALLVLFPTLLSAQPLSLKRESPKVAWPGCANTTRTEAVVRSQRLEAERLLGQATEASILGDNNAAVDLLTRAAVRDPSSEKVAYRLARALESLNRRSEAITEYCRFVALAPASADAPEARQRIAALTNPDGFAVPAAAATAFQTALSHYDAGRLLDAETSLGSALELVPDWADALYDRGAIRLALGKHAAASSDLRRYLELVPGSPEFNAILRALGPARPAAPRYSESTAFATGLILPGMGQFTIGRPVRGGVFLGAAASAVIFGAVMRRVEIDCLAPSTNGRCPRDQIVRQDVERPYLAPAIGAAAVIGFFGAVDALLGARSLNRTNESQRVGDGGAALDIPSVHLGANGPHIDLIRLRF